MAHLAHYREAHPLPFVITHWINLISMITLILTGFYIHYPLFGGFMGVFRGAHVFFGFVIVINCIVRVIISFSVKSAPMGGTRETQTEYKNWLPQKANKHQMGAWMKYYLFAKKDHPLGAKYGNPQKMAYLVIPILLLFMGYTGFCLWEPTSTLGFFAAFTTAVGGPMIVRIVHYFMMWVFICFTMLHGYLALIEGLGPLFLMFGWKESPGLTINPETGVIGPEDSLGRDKSAKKHEAETSAD